RLSTMLATFSPTQRIKVEQRNLTLLTERLARAVLHDVRIRNDRFQASIRMLQALNPLNIMERGYSIVYRDGVVTNSITSMEIGSNIQIKLQDGVAEAIVQTITTNDREE